MLQSSGAVIQLDGFIQLSVPRTGRSLWHPCRVGEAGEGLPVLQKAPGSQKRASLHPGWSLCRGWGWGCVLCHIPSAQDTAEPSWILPGLSAFHPSVPLPSVEFGTPLSAEFQMFTPLSTPDVRAVLFWVLPRLSVPFPLPIPRTGTLWNFFPICVLTLIPVPVFYPAWCRD